MLLPEWRQWSLEKLSMADRPIIVDLFASPTMTAAPLFITREMDAFTYNWTRLNSESHTILWANPPFRLLDQVLEKIQSEPCTIALCTPKWTDRSWYKELTNIYARRIELPQKRRLYMGTIRKTPLPQCDWHTVVWLVNTSEMPRLLKKIPPPTSGKGLADLHRELWELHKKRCPLPFIHEPNIQLGECPNCHTPIFTAGTELVGPTLDTRPRENTRLPKDIEAEENPNIQPNYQEEPQSSDIATSSTHNFDKKPLQQHIQPTLTHGNVTIQKKRPKSLQIEAKTAEEKNSVDQEKNVAPTSPHKPTAHLRGGVKVVEAQQ